METFLVLVGLHKVRDDIPQLVGTVPLWTGTGVHASCFVLSSSIAALFRFLRISRAIPMYSMWRLGHPRIP